MESLHRLETIILLLAAVLALTTIAQKILIPYPILLVIGGLILGVLPGLPTVTLSPDLVFLVFLPPILWAAAYFTSLREFRQNLRPISLLAVGLVLVTTATVAAVAHAVLPGMGWAEAIALGAIISPPDAVSATAIGKRLRIPRRVVTILEGESLVNDATALVLYRVAVGAAVSGAFSVGGAILANRAIEPINRITTTAQQVSAAHLSQRIEMARGDVELKRLAEAFNQMLERLDQSFTQIRQFSADASHELRTPLAILMGETELASHDLFEFFCRVGED